MAYSYASDKQITAELIAGDILPSSGFTSSYDAGNRLTTWQTPLASASTQQQAWNYDNAGNWNSTTINGTTENRTHNAADQLNTIAGNAATNDLKGNLTAYEINGKEYEVEYDLDNRIIKVEVNNSDVEYRYDAFGRRIIRQEGSTKSALIWWGNSECAEHKHQAGQTVIQNDIMAHPSRLNSVIARAKDGSKFKLEWYHKNYLDHVYAVSDDSGDILEHYRYTAFGQVTIYDENGAQVNTTQIDNHILWNTRRRDEVTGYYMYKYRHYSAELGRWLARDPIEESGGVNLYAFVENNGINLWDRLGHEGIPFAAREWKIVGHARLLLDKTLTIRIKCEKHPDDYRKGCKKFSLFKGGFAAFLNVSMYEEAIDHEDFHVLEIPVKFLLAYGLDIKASHTIDGISKPDANRRKDEAINGAVIKLASTLELQIHNIYGINKFEAFCKIEIDPDILKDVISKHAIGPSKMQQPQQHQHNPAGPKVIPNQGGAAPKKDPVPDIPIPADPDPSQEPIEPIEPYVPF